MLPSNVSFGTVVGRFMRAVADGPDTGRDPDGIPLAGLTVKFIPSSDRFKNATATPPVMIVADPITATTDADGYLIDAEGEQGIRLLATDDEDLNPTGWTWGVAISGTGFRTLTFNFALPTDGEIDLATVVPVPGNPGQAMQDWLAAVAASEAAATSAGESAVVAVAAAVDAVAAKDAAEAVPATNDGIMTSVAADEGSAFATQLSATIGVRGVATKSVGDSITAADLLDASTWDSDTDYFIPLAPPADLATGSEFTLISAGAGVGRVVAAEENLFPFPDAEAGISGGIWMARGTSDISVAVGVGPDGGDAIRVTSTGSTSSGAFGHFGNAGGQWLISDLGLKPGDVVSARAWLSPPAGQNGRIQLRFYRWAATLSDFTTTGTTGVGVRYVNGATIPEGTTHIAVVSYTTASAAGQTCDIAAARIARGDGPVPSYMDGSSEGGEWWGVPSQSPSSIGRVVGDSVVPAGGRSILRYEGGGHWRVSPVSTGADVLRTSDTLAVDRDNGQAGMFAPSSPFSTSDTALSSGRTYVTRFIPSRDMLVQGIGFRVTTVAATDDPCDVGIYSSAGARIVSSGAVTGYLNGTAGMRVVPVDAALLEAGKVYYAALSGASTAAVRRGTVLADAFGTAIPALESGYLTAHPLASSLGALTAADAAILFVLRETT